MRYVLILKFGVPNGRVQWLSVDFSTREKAEVAAASAGPDVLSYSILEAD